MKTYKSTSSKSLADCSSCAYCQMETKDGNYNIKIKPKRNKNKKLQKTVSNFETKGEIKASRKNFVQRYRSGVNSLAVSNVLMWRRCLMSFFTFRYLLVQFVNAKKKPYFEN